MGIHPKIGITGLPRSGKSAVMEKVLSMLKEERERELSARNQATLKSLAAYAQSRSLKMVNDSVTKSEI